MQPISQLSQFLPYQLSIASNAVSGRIALEYRTRFGLSIPEWRIMAILGDAGEQTQRDLTRRTLMDKVAVNRACKLLEERELAERTPNEQDGRSHLLALTAAGQAIHNEIMALAKVMEQRLFEGFSKDEIVQFSAMLARVREKADDLPEDEIGSSNDFGIG